MAKKRNGKNCLGDREVEEAREFVAKRDGWQCCFHKEKKRWKHKLLLLHHNDGNPENNPRDGSNWSLACRPHHSIRHPRGPSRFSSARNVRIEDLRTARPQTEEMRRNQLAYPLFIEYFTVCMEEDEKVDIDDICGYVHRITHGLVTCATVERYCNDITRGNSPYFIDKDDNCIRAHPVSAEPPAVENIEPENGVGSSRAFKVAG